MLNPKRPEDRSYRVHRHPDTERKPHPMLCARRDHCQQHVDRRQHHQHADQPIIENAARQRQRDERQRFDAKHRDARKQHDDEHAVRATRQTRRNTHVPHQSTAPATSLSAARSNPTRPQPPARTDEPHHVIPSTPRPCVLDRPRRGRAAAALVADDNPEWPDSIDVEQRVEHSDVPAEQTLADWTGGARPAPRGPARRTRPVRQVPARRPQRPARTVAARQPPGRRSALERAGVMGLGHRRARGLGRREAPGRLVVGSDAPQRRPAGRRLPGGLLVRLALRARAPRAAGAARL